MISTRAGTIEDLVLARLGRSPTMFRPRMEKSACQAREPLFSPPPRYPRHASRLRPACTPTTTTTTRPRQSKSDDATRTANQFQPACAKHHRLAPGAPLSLSLTAGEGEGRSRTCHIFCLFPAVLHATHAHAHTYTRTHTFTPLTSSFSHLFALGPGLGGLVLSGGPDGVVPSLDFNARSTRGMLLFVFLHGSNVSLSSGCAPMTARLP
jgi:hypothetical protein